LQLAAQEKLWDKGWVDVGYAHPIPGLQLEYSIHTATGGAAMFDDHTAAACKISAI